MGMFDIPQELQQQVSKRLDRIRDLNLDTNDPVMKITNNISNIFKVISNIGVINFSKSITTLKLNARSLVTNFKNHDDIEITDKNITAAQEIISILQLLQGEIEKSTLFKDGKISIAGRETNLSRYLELYIDTMEWQIQKYEQNALVDEVPNVIQTTSAKPEPQPTTPAKASPTTHQKSIKPDMEPETETVLVRSKRTTVAKLGDKLRRKRSPEKDKVVGISAVNDPPARYEAKQELSADTETPTEFVLSEPQSNTAKFKDRYVQATSHAQNKLGVMKKKLTGETTYKYLETPATVEADLTTIDLYMESISVGLKNKAKDEIMNLVKEIESIQKLRCQDSLKIHLLGPKQTESDDYDDLSGNIKSYDKSLQEKLGTLDRLLSSYKTIDTVSQKEWDSLNVIIENSNRTQTEYTNNITFIAFCTDRISSGKMDEISLIDIDKRINFFKEHENSDYEMNLLFELAEKLKGNILNKICSELDNVEFSHGKASRFALAFKGEINEIINNCRNIIKSINYRSLPQSSKPSDFDVLLAKAIINHKSNFSFNSGITCLKDLVETEQKQQLITGLMSEMMVLQEKHLLQLAQKNPDKKLIDQMEKNIEVYKKLINLIGQEENTSYSVSKIFQSNSKAVLPLMDEIDSPKVNDLFREAINPFLPSYKDQDVEEFVLVNIPGR